MSVRRTMITLFLLLGLALSATAAPNRLYVKFDQPGDNAVKLEQVRGVKHARSLQPMAAEGDAAQEVARWVAVDMEGLDGEAIDNLRALPGVALVEEMPKRTTQVDRSTDGVPLDPMMQFQWHLQAVSAFSAWDRVTDASSVTIAVLDNGFDMNHPDLVSAYWTNSAEANGGSGIDDDGNGFIDDVHGYDFCGSTGSNPDGNPDAPNEGVQPNHGTHCAGIAAATMNNGIGVAGIAPGAKVMAVRVGVDLTIYYPVEGILYAVDNGADIISMSFSGEIESVFERDAVRYALEQGVVLFAASGNDYSSDWYYPAAYEGVIAVAATGQQGNLAPFSNRGPWVDVAAPGVAILSTAIDGYLYLDGTSMATPLVAGIAALILADSPGLTPAEIRARLSAGATDLRGGEALVSAGAVDAYRAVVSDRPAFYPAEVRTVSESGVDYIEPGTHGEVFVRLALFGQDFQEGTLGFLSTSSDLSLLAPEAYPLTIGPASAGDTLDFTVNLTADNVVRRGDHDLLIGIVADGWRDTLRVPVPVDRPWANQETGGMVVSVTDFGALGFRDIVNIRTSSEGIRLKSETVGYLFHGSLMVSDGSLVSDCAYGADNSNRFDFFPIDGGRLTEVDASDGEQKLRAVFTDFGANANPVGVKVAQTTTTQTSGDNIIRYDFDINKWTSGSADYDVAMYLDWDIGDIYDNTVKYNEATGLSYMVGPGGAAGVMPVTNTLNSTPLVAVAAIENYGTVYSDNLNDTFTDAEKLAVLGSGTDDATGVIPQDYSHLVAVRVSDVGATISKRASFLIMAARTESALLSLAQGQAAKAIPGTVSGSGSTLPQRFALSPAWPNPFNGTTRMTLNLPIGGDAVTVAVYDLLGRRVRQLQFKGQAGPNELVWDGRSDSGSRVASGVYLVRANSNGSQAERRITLLK